MRRLSQKFDVDTPVPVEVLPEILSEEEWQTPPKKLKIKGRLGAVSYKTRFQREWVDKFDDIAEVPSNQHVFRCLVCVKEVSCCHMGLNDVKRHLLSATHIKKRDQKPDNKQQKFPLSENKSIIAELRLCNIFAQKNIPISVSDRMSSFIRTNFDKDQRAKNFTAGRTKMTALLDVLASDIRSKLISRMKSGPYSIYTDGSNDNSLLKMMPLTISTVDENNNITTDFLDMGLTQSTTAQAMFDMIENTLIDNQISLDNCVALAVDNTNANMGAHNSLKVKMEAANPSIYVVGCVCHMLHNAACHGTRKLEEDCGVDVEEIVSDVYLHFKNSSNRKQEFQTFCEFVNVEFKVIIKHIRVRWLSLVKAIERILHLYEPLKSYFISSDLKDPSTKRLKRAFQQPLTEIYLWCVHSFASILTKSNLTLQKGEPMIHQLRSICEDAMVQCLNRFCMLDGTEQIQYMMDIDELPRKSNSAVRIGLAARGRLAQLVSAEDIDDRGLEKFYRSIFIYFEATTKYLSSHLPLSDDFLRMINWVNPSEIVTSNGADVVETALRYRKVLKLTDEQMDELEDKYCCLQRDSLLRNNHDNALEFWRAVSQIPKYHLVSRTAFTVMLIPHSNAVAERVFSMIGKNLTASRKCLRKDSTLTNIMTIKCADLPEDFSPSEDLVHCAKRATRICLQD